MQAGMVHDHVTIIYPTLRNSFTAALYFTGKYQCCVAVPETPTEVSTKVIDVLDRYRSDGGALVCPNDFECHRVFLAVRFCSAAPDNFPIKNDIRRSNVLDWLWIRA